VRTAAVTSLGLLFAVELASHVGGAAVRQGDPSFEEITRLVGPGSPDLVQADLATAGHKSGDPALRAVVLPGAWMSGPDRQRPPRALLVFVDGRAVRFERTELRQARAASETIAFYNRPRTPVLLIRCGGERPCRDATVVRTGPVKSVAVLASRLRVSDLLLVLVGTAASTWLGILACRGLGRGRLVLCIAAAAAALGLWVVLKLPSTPWSGHMISAQLLALALAALRHAHPAGRTARAWRPAPLVGAALFLALSVGATLRVQHLDRIGDRPLWPDAVKYRAIAERMAHPYDTSLREPLWPAVVRAWFELVGSSDVALRTLTIGFSLTLVLVSYWFASRFMESQALGLLTAGALALNRYWVGLSVQGLREELYTILVVLLAFFCLADPRKVRPGPRLRGITVVMAAAAVLRITSLVLSVPLLFYSLWKHRLGWRPAVLPLSATVALLVPHLAYEKLEFGDWLYSINAHASFYEDYEFSVRQEAPCSGCPAPAAGAPPSMAGYLLGRHDPSTIARRTARGLYDLFLRPSEYLRACLGSVAPAALGLYAIGTCMLLATPRRDLLLVPPLSINVLAFVAPLDIDPRLVMHNGPFLAMLMVLPLARAGEASARWFGRRLDPPSSGWVDHPVPEARLDEPLLAHDTRAGAGQT
jgi:hypothetical protein